MRLRSQRAPPATRVAHEESGAAHRLRRSPARRHVPRPAGLCSTGRWRARSGASTCSRSSIPSTAPTPASTRSTTRRSIVASAPGTTSPRWRRSTDVMADVIVNHISRRSPQFQDYDRRGGDSPYRRDVSHLRPRVPGRRPRAGPAGAAHTAPEPAVHQHRTGWGETRAAVDHVHQRSDRHRRPSSGGSPLPRRRASLGCMARASVPSASTPSAMRSSRRAPAAS